MADGTNPTLLERAVLDELANQVDLVAGSAGTINFADGSTMTFSGIERITY